jgi:hypothetical protein
VGKIPIDDYLAICQTKARYCRCLDEKDWDGYADTFIPDVILDTTGSGGGETRGREKLLLSVRASIEDAITVHQVHSPEMTLVDADTVSVIWAMQDRVIWSEARAKTIGKRSLTGFGHYRERYVRCDDGSWRIAHSRLTRLHIDFESDGKAP